MSRTIPILIGLMMLGCVVVIFVLGNQNARLERSLGQAAETVALLETTFQPADRSVEKAEALIWACESLGDYARGKESVSIDDLNTKVADLGLTNPFTNALIAVHSVNRDEQPVEGGRLPLGDIGVHIGKPGESFFTGIGYHSLARASYGLVLTYF